MIRPGMLTVGDAAALSRSMADLAELQTQVQQISFLVREEFPAQMTAWDSASGSITWHEREFDSAGARIDKIAPRSGGPGSYPAYPVGNGSMPPRSFPVDIWLRRRDVTGNSVAYEFDWLCACPQPSGSGAGGGIATTCCPNGLPSILIATFIQTSGTPCVLDQQSVTLSYIGSGAWQGVTALGGITWTVQVICSSGSWLITVTTGIGACDFNNGIPVADSCSPLHLAAGGVGPFGMCAVCSAATFTIVVTEQ